MNVGIKTTVILPEPSTLLGVADETLATSLAHEIERFAGTGCVAIASTLSQLRQFPAAPRPR